MHDDDCEICTMVNDETFALRDDGIEDNVGDNDGNDSEQVIPGIRRYEEKH